jgi:hypothetical protein
MLFCVYEFETAGHILLDENVSKNLRDSRYDLL